MAVSSESGMVLRCCREGGLSGTRKTGRFLTGEIWKGETGLTGLSGTGLISALWGEGCCDHTLVLLVRSGERSGDRIDLAADMDKMALCGVLEDGISDLNRLRGVLSCMMGAESSGLGLLRRLRAFGRAESTLSSSCSCCSKSLFAINVTWSSSSRPASEAGEDCESRTPSKESYCHCRIDSSCSSTKDEGTY